MNAIVHHFTAADGTDLAWHELGEGRPVVLLHGLFSDAWTNWLRYGHAAAIVGPLAMTQALAFGAERGEPGGGFLLASALAFLALLITLFLVVPRLRSKP